MTYRPKPRTASNVRIYRLTNDISGLDNLYRHSGACTLNDYPLEVEVFVKDAGTRAIVGRWLPCPNAGVALRIQRIIRKERPPLSRPSHPLTEEG